MGDHSNMRMRDWWLRRQEEAGRDLIGPGVGRGSGGLGERGVVSAIIVIRMDILLGTVPIHP